MRARAANNSPLCNKFYVLIIWFEQFTKDGKRYERCSKMVKSFTIVLRCPKERCRRRCDVVRCGSDGVDRRLVKQAVCFCSRRKGRIADKYYHGGILERPLIIKITAIKLNLLCALKHYIGTSTLHCITLTSTK